MRMCCTAGDFEIVARVGATSLPRSRSLGDSAETRALVAALTPKVRACPEALTNVSLSGALYGLHRLPDSPEMSALLRALTAKVRARPATHRRRA